MSRTYPSQEKGLTLEKECTRPGPAQSLLNVSCILKALAGAGIVEASSNCLNILMVAAQAGAVDDVALPG
ncbi:hypothetical protein FS837_005701, partial [Tulasnella sp. UAMH 9824]